jgi:hypothetical protein
MQEKQSEHDQQTTHTVILSENDPREYRHYRGRSTTGRILSPKSISEPVWVTFRGEADE